ncbi:hypothetical protein F8S09_06170 [Deinococcus sp. SDU3-2]|uniref:Uncharacterized protein n=1 Tax=Deinococcus terrestris TaxID=2651870 RepID=A0A7X1TQZ7_9DEIO|nr:hypothetical protein [Deinococcus terrestris]MPY66283.1 hypothetical protein [Deinococcus terrestris]
MSSTDESLAFWLARRARQLGLERAALEQADAEALQSFALVVLEELAARGLMPGGSEVGCWSRPRSRTN